MEFQFQIFDNDRYNYSRLFGGGGGFPTGPILGQSQIEGGGRGRGLHKSTYRKLSSFLFAHCHNIHGIAPHGARHVIETAALAPISSSTVVQEGSLEDW